MPPFSLRSVAPIVTPLRKHREVWGPLYMDKILRPLTKCSSSSVCPLPPSPHLVLKFCGQALHRVFFFPLPVQRRRWSNIKCGGRGCRCGKGGEGKLQGSQLFVHLLSRSCILSTHASTSMTRARRESTASDCSLNKERKLQE